MAKSQRYLVRKRVLEKVFAVSWCKESWFLPSPVRSIIVILPPPRLPNKNKQFLFLYSNCFVHLDDLFVGLTVPWIWFDSPTTWCHRPAKTSSKPMTLDSRRDSRGRTGKCKTHKLRGTLSKFGLPRKFSAAVSSGVRRVRENNTDANLQIIRTCPRQFDTRRKRLRSDIRDGKIDIFQLQNFN